MDYCLVLSDSILLLWKILILIHMYYQIFNNIKPVHYHHVCELKDKKCRGILIKIKKKYIVEVETVYVAKRCLAV